MDVHIYGGQTRINLVFETLLEAAGHLSTVSSACQDYQALMRGTIQRMQDEGAWIPFSPHIPPLQAGLFAQAAAAPRFESAVERLISGIYQAHDAYWDMEAVAKTLFDLKLIAGSSMLDTQKALRDGVEVSEVTDAALASLSGVLSAATRAANTVPILGEAMSGVVIYERNIGWTAEQMAIYEQQVNLDPKAEYSGEFDGSYHQFLDHYSQVSDFGDIAVTRIEDRGQYRYAVHLPGFNFNPDDASEGRGQRSLIDSVINDSHQIEPLIEQTLEAAGVPEGSEIYLSGYSMGGLHAINLASEDGAVGNYPVAGVTTIGAPGANRRIDHEIPTVHFQDLYDPVPNLMTQRHPESTTRLTISYQHSSPDIESTTITGSAHTYQHNIDAVERLEQNPPEALGEAETAVMDNIRHHYQGTAQTQVYSTDWLEREEVEMGWDNVMNMSEELHQEFRFRTPSLGGRRSLTGGFDG